MSLIMGLHKTTPLGRVKLFVKKDRGAKKSGVSPAWRECPHPL
jgi:hypothetical protein